MATVISYGEEGCVECAETPDNIQESDATRCLMAIIGVHTRGL
jgi:hypothetical protein